MGTSHTAVDDVATLARRLSPMDRFLLLEQLISEMKLEFMTSTVKKRSLYGLCADLGPAPSTREIDLARHEMWGGFPREDF